MDVRGENTRLWISERQKRDGGTWQDYSIGVSKKSQEGNYITTYIKARFTKDVRLPEGLENGAKMDYEGFMSVDHYFDADNNEVKRPLVVVTSATFDAAPVVRETVKYTDEQIAGFSASEDDIPF